MNTALIEAKACPFCDSHSLDLNVDPSGHTEARYVACNSCDAWGPSAETDSGAIENWNKRA